MNKEMLLARTPLLNQVARMTEGASLFFMVFERSKIEVRLTYKSGQCTLDSNVLHIPDLWIREMDRIGVEGGGCWAALRCLNPERILLGALKS